MSFSKQTVARLRRRRGRDRQGVMLVLVAILLMGILILIGFSIDLAHMMSARTELRAAADLAAKAAAGELSRTQELEFARAAAQEVAMGNRVAGEGLTLSDDDIVFGHSKLQSDGRWDFQEYANPLNSVKVNARRVDGAADGPVNLFFGSLYGMRNFQAKAAATALFLDVDICLVLDRSSSMKLPVGNWDGLMSVGSKWFCRPPRQSSRWVALDGAVELFVDHLSDSQAIEHVALVTFASDYRDRCGVRNRAATVDQDLNGDLARVTAAMESRSDSVWNGMTDIASGIELGHDVLTGSRARTYSTKVMIVLTDGVYTEADPAPAAEAAADDDIFIHTITFGQGANQEDMRTVAEVGSGNHFHAPNRKALEDVFEQIAGSITILTE